MAITPAMFFTILQMCIRDSLEAVGAEYNRRALPHPVFPFELRNAFVPVFHGSLFCHKSIFPHISLDVVRYYYQYTISYLARFFKWAVRMKLGVRYAGVLHIKKRGLFLAPAAPLGNAPSRIAPVLDQQVQY